MPATATLITGASSGIGLHLASVFAAQQHNLVLVARYERALETIALDLEAEFGVRVHTIGCDLAEESAAQDIWDELAEMGIPIGVLVNNAGHGFRGDSWEIPLEQDISMVRLNIEAVLRLTKLFLPPMIARGDGRILNVASLAGFLPGPLCNVYHASKAFLLSWSEALAVELEATGVVVTALCHGPTETDFLLKAELENLRGFKKASVMAPQDVAKAGYEGLMKGKLLVIPGEANKALVMSRRLLTEQAQAKLTRRFYEQVPPGSRKWTQRDEERWA
jgi:short-subunit dehydrogenase